MLFREGQEESDGFVAYVTALVSFYNPLTWPGKRDGSTARTEEET